jgi:hypothetical protein
MGDQNYLKLLRASEGTLSRWSQLHLQSFVPTPVSRRVDVRQAVGRKKQLPNLYHNMMKTCCTDPDKDRKKKKIFCSADFQRFGGQPALTCKGRFPLRV